MGFLVHSHSDPGKRFTGFGLSLQTTCETESCWTELQQLLAPFPFAVAQDVSGRGDLRLDVRASSSPLELPILSVAPQDAFGVKSLDVGDSRYVSDGCSLFHVTPSEGVGQLVLHSSFASQSTLHKLNAFLLGFFPLLLARGFYDLHAAAVARDDVGYLFIGDSGSGKSTTALNLVAAGWDYLSDDAVLLRRGDTGVETLGFRRKFCLDPNVGRHWPELRDKFDSSESTDPTKRFIDLETVYRNRLRESVTPKVLVFTRIVAEQTSTLRPLSNSAGFVRLLQQSASLSFNRQYAKEHLAVLRELLQQCASYELLAGRDVYDDPRRLVTLFERDAMAGARGESMSARAATASHSPVLVMERCESKLRAQQVEDGSRLSPG